ncbi:MAG: DUF2786 domain-containing protein [Deltaproteobacteria bacterium]|jgi:hypothetical protein|nr:DUF2786 domain-containing protein [Deltaproteobacteria bacterium]
MAFTLRGEELKRKFRNNWVLQLTAHHDWILSEMRGLGAFPGVIIELIESDVSWGYWKPDTRVIALNARLILDYPWDVVIGILKHETAHQIVSDAYPSAASNEPPHGSHFQSVCRRMKLLPMFCHAKVDLRENGGPPCPIGPKNSHDEENPLFVKIKKLLALSGSPEPHEAEAALTKASELMARHNIDTAALLADSEDYEIWRIPLNCRRIERKNFLIAMIIRNHFFVRTVTNEQYDPWTNQPAKYLELIGRPVNLNMAKHVFHYLTERVESLWGKHKPMAAHNGEKGLGAKTAFITNLLLSLDSKLTAAELERSRDALKARGVLPGNDVTAVIPSDFIMSDQKLQSFVEQNYPRLRNTARSHRHSFAPYSSSAGREAGKNLDIFRPIAEGQRRDGSVKGYLGED